MNDSPYSLLNLVGIIIYGICGGLIVGIVGGLLLSFAIMYILSYFELDMGDALAGIIPIICFMSVMFTVPFYLYKAVQKKVEIAQYVDYLTSFKKQT